MDVEEIRFDVIGDGFVVLWLPDMHFSVFSIGSHVGNESSRYERLEHGCLRVFILDFCDYFSCVYKSDKYYKDSKLLNNFWEGILSRKNKSS